MPAHMAAAENHLKLLGAHTQKLSADIASNGVLIERLNFKMTWLVIIASAVIIAAVFVTSRFPESSTHAQCGRFQCNGCVGLTQTMSTTVVVGSAVVFMLLF